MIVTLMLGVVWQACSPENQQPVLFNRTPVPEASRLPSAPIVQIDNASDKKYIADVLKIDKVINLQLTDSSIIAYISDLAVIDDRILILDKKQAQLFLFRKDGTFLKRVGELGEGPGEYINPVYVASSGAEFLVLDVNRRTLLRYDRDGLWIKSDHFDTGVAPINDLLCINEKLFLPSPVYTLSRDPKLPVNLIYDLKEKQVLWGFEKRYPPFYRKEPVFQPGYTSFSSVGNRVWFAPPYSSEIFIYDLEGRFIKKRSPGILDGLSLDDYQGASGFDDFLKIWSSKYANSRMFHVDPYVLVTFRGKANTNERMSIFDTAGNILVKNLKIKNNILFTGLKTAHGEHIIGAVDIDFFKKSAIDSFLTKQQKAMFIEAGWDDQNQGDSEDNAYLVFYKVAL